MTRFIFDFFLKNSQFTNTSCSFGKRLSVSVLVLVYCVMVVRRDVYRFRVISLVKYLRWWDFQFAGHLRRNGTHLGRWGAYIRTGIGRIFFIWIAHKRPYFVTIEHTLWQRTIQKHTHIHTQQPSFHSFGNHVTIRNPFNSILDH